MIYTNYTNGEEFTDSGFPYIGYFTVVDGIAYSGKIKNEKSKILSPTGTFLSRFYMKEMRFGDVGSSMKNESFNVFDILNKSELDRKLDNINNNNLLILSTLIMPNPSVFRYDNTKSFFVGLSSSEIDMRNDDILTGKIGEVQIDPFEMEGGLSFLNRVKHSLMLGESNDRYLYICSDGDTFGIFSGSFSNPTDFIIEEIRYDDEVNGIYFNEIDEKVFIVKDSFVQVIDVFSLRDCRSDISTFNINLTNEEVVGGVKFGKDIRLHFSNNTLKISNKYSGNLERSVNMKKYNIKKYYSHDIRAIDDLICVIFEREDNKTVILIIDGLDENVYELDDIPNNLQNIEVILSKTNYNTFFTRFNSEIQQRFIKFPKNPTSKINKETLKYLRGYKLNDTFQTFGDSILKWNSNSLESNNFNNLSFSEISNDHNIFYMLHNIGRLYPIKATPTKSYITSFDPSLKSQFEYIYCDDDSFGISLNDVIRNVVLDALALYRSASNKFVFKNGKIEAESIRDIQFNIDDLIFNVNEGVNVIPLRRIIDSVVELQKNILDN